MEYDVNRIEFVKAQRTYIIKYIYIKHQKYIIQMSEHIFQICIDYMFTIIYFQKLLFHYVATFSVKYFICSIASHLLSSSVFVHHSH